MTSYEQYLAILDELNLGLIAMPQHAFDQGEAALRQKLPFAFSSVIDMDAFEASLES